MPSRLAPTSLCDLDQIAIFSCNVFRMKTTLNIDERLMARVKQEAARQGRTMSEFIESALRLALQNRQGKPSLTALSTFSGGPFRANIADNDALQDFMEGR